MASETDISNGGAGAKYLYAIQNYYYKTLDSIWKKIPNFLGIIISTVIIFIAGSTMRGDWLLILVHFIRSFRPQTNETETDSPAFNMADFSLEQLRLQGVPFFIIMNLAVSFTLYFGLCGFLQWYFYIRQADRPEDWKCQPTKFLPQEAERHEIVWGSMNVALGSVVFGAIACYIYNGGYTKLYFNVLDHGLVWLIFQIPLIFFMNDIASFYSHRIMHYPYLYKKLHKIHHYYKQPTAFSVTAFHPIEFLYYQSLLVIPAFTIHINVFVYVGNLLYIYYYGIMNHSGIVMGPSPWPWQPDNIFHDNHHQYFNINFGFNLEWWDKLHHTYRHVDNSLVGKKLTSAPFRTDEKTLQMEKEHMEGIACYNTDANERHQD